MKKVAVLQSNYIPWKGYFDIINDVDLLIFYDDVQYTKNDWRNRNIIKTISGANWLTIPVAARLNLFICEVKITNSQWAVKHFKTLAQYYSKAPYYKKYKSFLEYVYLEKKWLYLSEINQFLIKAIANDFLGIKTEFRDSREYLTSGRKLDRLLDLLKKVNTDVYISGPTAKYYINENIFRASSIQLIYKDYSDYPEYSQFYPPFIHEVSILDLLFQTGEDAPYYIWGWRNTMFDENESNGTEIRRK